MEAPKELLKQRTALDLGLNEESEFPLGKLQQKLEAFSAIRGHLVL
jgi:hypothetical protein